jgi:hypothetical protein
LRGLGDAFVVLAGVWRVEIDMSIGRTPWSCGVVIVKEGLVRLCEYGEAFVDLLVILTVRQENEGLMLGRPA